MTVLEAATDLGVSKARVFQLINELNLKPRVKHIRVRVLELSNADMVKLRARKQTPGPKKPRLIKQGSEDGTRTR